MPDWKRASACVLMAGFLAGAQRATPRSQTTMPRSAPSLADLPNLGPRSQQVLALAGIATLAELRKVGSVAAYARAKHAGANISLNLLWALEGALTGLPWQTVAREHRTSLLLALEEHQRGVQQGSLAQAASRRGLDRV